VTFCWTKKGHQHDIGLYFQNDGTSLFIGIDSQWGSGWDVVWDIAIDGDYSRTMNGNLSQPYTDIDICDQRQSFLTFRRQLKVPDKLKLE